jgi:hypothetical protein
MYFNRSITLDLGLNNVSVKSYCLLMYSIGSSLNRVTSLCDSSMIGIIVSYIKFSMNGFKYSVVTSCFNELPTNLIALFKHFDPTNYVFLLKTMFNYDSSSGTPNVDKKYFENS